MDVSFLPGIEVGAIAVIRQAGDIQHGLVINVGGADEAGRRTITVQFNDFDPASKRFYFGEPS